MSDAVIVAIITGGVTLTVNLVANWTARRRDAVQNAVRDQELKDKLDVLEKKVDEHNGYAKRFGEIEKAIVRIDTKMESLHNRK